MAREGFMDGLRRVATQKECTTKWNGAPAGRDFRCYLCGHHFQVGDGWRWQYVGPLGDKGPVIDGKRYGCCNFKVCDKCDGPDVIDRWVALHNEFHAPRFWALH